MLMTIWEKRYLDFFVQMLGKKNMQNAILTILLAINSRDGARISAPIQSHLLWNDWNKSLCHQDRIFSLRSLFCIVDLQRQYTTEGRSWGSLIHTPGGTQESSTKGGLCKYSTLQLKIFFKKSYVIKQRTLNSSGKFVQIEPICQVL